MLKYSVVIPLYNKEHYIRETITSLALQRRKPDELILVDDASSDNSLTVAKLAFLELQEAFSTTSIGIIELAINGGPGNARNVGLEQATGDLISFLDGDDSYEEGFIETAISYMTHEHIKFLVVGMKLSPSNIQYPDVSKLKPFLSPINDELFTLPHPLIAVSSPFFFMGRGSNVVVFREMIGSHRYETNSLLNEGVDFWYRILKSVVAEKHGKIGLLKGDYILVTEVPDSLSRKKYTTWKEPKIPPTVSRYRRSKDKYDQQLAGMLSLRWFKHALNNLPNYRQKGLFVFQHKSLLVRAFKYRFEREFIKNRGF